MEKEIERLQVDKVSLAYHLPYPNLFTDWLIASQDGLEEQRDLTEEEIEKMEGQVTYSLTHLLTHSLTYYSKARLEAERKKAEEQERMRKRREEAEALLRRGKEGPTRKLL